ncbi:TPA: immunoglobulin-binding protein, partial [Escherichia coli]
KTITDSTAGISWIDIDDGGQSLEEVTVIDRQQNNKGYNFAVGSGAAILDADKSMAVGNKTAVFNADNSVALGYGSQVNGESNVLSVGAGPSGYGVSVDGAPETRRI